MQNDGQLDEDNGAQEAQATMPQIAAGLATMIQGSGDAQTALNALPGGMSDDQYSDLTALQTITTQIETLQKKYAAS